ncbi:unnamed protein product [Callosobruchus maculatus]|uniref:Uncharacterized protein n=1 Tax=Callosobruchus maculatus TaxID=64391 RepID=A0A653CTV4_CALMS|nr:unnamed protein product [Callosobruchus maculatus]
MTTAMVVDKEGRRPQYKDYNTFLERYKNGKREDQCSDSGVSFSLTNSSNNSSSSINSDLAEGPKKGFREYLENYNNKRYSPVQPAFVKGKTVKTEVYIEINNDATNNVNQITKVFQVQPQSNNAVSKTAKIFEKDAPSKTAGKANLFNGSGEQRKISAISKQFEEKQTVVKQPLKKKPSISEMTKVFEEPKEDDQTAEVRKKVFTEVAQVFKQKEESIQQKNAGVTSPKPQFLNSKPIFTQTAPKNSAVISPKPVIMTDKSNGVVTSPKPVIMTDKSNGVVISPKPLMVNGSSKPKITIIKPAPEGQEQSMILTNLPPPPPPPLPTSSPPSNPPLSPPVISVTPPSTCSSPAPLEPPNCPPPPPPMPVNFASRPSLPSEPKVTVQPQANKFNTLPKIQNGDTIDGRKLDKNDPRVKKMVYGALREMYGAYHDKANDYLATLPKNRVRRNNGLDSIINSIASQGGLDKLSGRANPNPDKE